MFMGAARNSSQGLAARLISGGLAYLPGFLNRK